MSVLRNEIAIYYHAEGRILNGPNGAKVSPDCPFMVKPLVEVQSRPFKQVQRWIMQIFQLSDTTHELTLQHILPVKYGTAPVYNVLIDIIGDDSWKAFLNVLWHHVGAPKLIVKWNVKKTTVAVESSDGIWPTCKHDKECTIETSWSREDPGRRFYRCPLFADPKEDCGFMQWSDAKFHRKAIEHINDFQDKVDKLSLQVDNLKNEVEELHRRRGKKSSHDAALGHGGKCSCNKVPCNCASGSTINTARLNPNP